MNSNKLAKLIVAASLSLSITSPSLAVDPKAKREIFYAYEKSVFGLKGTLKISANYQGQTRNEEAKIWSNATNIGKGLLVVAYSSISPNFPGGPNVQITKEITDLKLVNSTGIEFDAKLVLHDEDLDLAYIAVDPKGKNIANWKDQIIDTSNNTDLKHFDETINISRYAEHFDYQSAVTVGTVSSIQEKPRKLYQVLNSSMSAPSFNNNGYFIGITISRASKAGHNQASTPVTIPAKYIRKFIPIAIQHQAKLK